jgi:hypothetical protein
MPLSSLWSTGTGTADDGLVSSLWSTGTGTADDGLVSVGLTTCGVREPHGDIRQVQHASESISGQRLCPSIKPRGQGPGRRPGRCGLARQLLGLGPKPSTPSHRAGRRLLVDVPLEDGAHRGGRDWLRLAALGLCPRRAPVEVPLWHGEGRMEKLSCPMRQERHAAQKPERVHHEFVLGPNKQG